MKELVKLINENLKPRYPEPTMDSLFRLLNLSLLCPTGTQLGAVIALAKKMGEEQNIGKGQDALDLAFKQVGPDLLNTVISSVLASQQAGLLTIADVNDALKQEVGYNTVSNAWAIVNRVGLKLSGSLPDDLVQRLSNRFREVGRGLSWCPVCSHAEPEVLFSSLESTGVVSLSCCCRCSNPEAQLSTGKFHYTPLPLFANRPWDMIVEEFMFHVELMRYAWEKLVEDARRSTEALDETPDPLEEPEETYEHTCDTCADSEDCDHWQPNNEAAPECFRSVREPSVDLPNEVREPKDLQSTLDRKLCIFSDQGVDIVGLYRELEGLGLESNEEHKPVLTTSFTRSLDAGANRVAPIDPLVVEISLRCRDNAPEFSLCKLTLTPRSTVEDLLPLRTAWKKHACGS